MQHLPERPLRVHFHGQRRHPPIIPGVVIEFRKAETGPSGGKPIQVEVSSRDPARIAPVVAGIRAVMEDLGGFAAAEDDRPLPGIIGLMVTAQPFGMVMVGLGIIALAGIVVNNPWRICARSFLTA